MKRDQLSKIIGNIDDRHIAEAYQFHPEPGIASPERITTMNKKRIITLALAAALILALGVTAYAFFGVRYTATHNMPGTGQYTSLTALPEVERIIRYPITVPESFSDGHRFSQLRINGMADYNETGEMTREYYGVNVDYTKPGAADVQLSIEPVHTDVPDDIAASSELRQIEGRDVYYRLDFYKLVPPEYEETKDDLAREAGGNFFVSYGAPEISETVIASVIFDLNGARYTLLAFDADKAELEALGAMAGEIIASSQG